MFMGTFNILNERFIYKGKNWYGPQMNVNRCPQGKQGQLNRINI